MCRLESEWPCKKSLRQAPTNEMRKDMVVVASPTFVIKNKGQQKEKIHRVEEAKKCAWVCIHCGLQVEKEDGDAQPGYHKEATRGKARGWLPFGECHRKGSRLAADLLTEEDILGIVLRSRGSSQIPKIYSSPRLTLFNENHLMAKHAWKRHIEQDTKELGHQSTCHDERSG
jgi:hypothetical protein